MTGPFAKGFLRGSVLAHLFADPILFIMFVWGGHYLAAAVIAVGFTVAASILFANRRM